MVKHDYLWWNHQGNRAIRVGDWKLVADGEEPWEFYDLSTIVQNPKTWRRSFLKK